MRFVAFGFAASVATSLMCGAAENMDLYLLIGQSNMAGRGVLTDSNPVSADGIFKLDSAGEWQAAEEPIHFDKPSVAGAGLAASFARAMADSGNGVSIGLIPCAVGGTSIYRWVESGDLWSNAVARTRIALRSGTLKGILWHQGEGDCSATSAPAWGAKLEGMIVSFRREFGSVPFVAGELGRYLDNTGWRVINAHLHALEGKVPNYRVVSSEGLTPNSDNVHFSTESLREFGLRYAEAMMSCVASRPDSAQLNSGFGWIWESAFTSGRTGSWSGDVTYGGGRKAWLDGENVFTPYAASGGRKIELTMTLEMSECAMDGSDPGATAQCAIRLGTNGCFQAWAGGASAGTAQWIDVAAEGVVPSSGKEYSFRIAIDYSSQTYSAAVLGGEEWIPLAAQSGAVSFPLAVRANCLSRVRFSGDTFFDTLFGDFMGGSGSGLTLRIR